jgi:chemotaxis protein CheD
MIKPNEFFLHPGMIFFAGRDPHEVTTVLGSCVSVCLWDRRLETGGMNHYILPLWNGEGLPSPRYGNIAIRKLIEALYAFGCERKTLMAKVFGGASLMNNRNQILNVGERNILLAADLLEEEGISVVGLDVGGSSGRKLIFDTRTGVVKVKKLSPALAKSPYHEVADSDQIMQGPRV